MQFINKTSGQKIHLQKIHLHNTDLCLYQCFKNEPIFAATDTKAVIHQYILFQQTLANNY